MAHHPEFLLLASSRSTCAARLRIALTLKQIPVEYAYVENGRSRQYCELNPSGSVPLLTHCTDEAIDFPLTQSVAALEYLEEVYTYQVPLLPPPSHSLARAQVRTLVNIIANDIQPMTTQRVAKALCSIAVDPLAWNQDFIERGLQAYETVASKTAGLYSVGDSVTLADVCLVPALWAAEKNRIALDHFPTVKRIFDALSALEAFQSAHWAGDAHPRS